jgi:DNA modification methylase
MSEKDLQYPQDFIDKILCGDALELIKKIPDSSIDIIISDPPYGISKKDIKNSESLETFYKILPECYRVLKPDSFFITFFSTKRLPELFINNPFIYFWQIILYCAVASVHSPVGYTKFMSCFVFKKGNPKVTKWNKDIFVDTPTKMIEPDEGFINHPSPKPKRFIGEIIKMFSKEDDLILDPFIGSGSTALACSINNRRFIGFEIYEDYCRLTKQRLENLKNKFIYPLKGFK